MKSVDIKGKPYIEVNERLKFFRENYPNYRLTSDIIELKDGRVVMIACVIDDTGTTLATGHAYEKEDSTFINKTSFIENCETSAWGRALGNFGIGIDTAVASAEEVQNAIKQQKEPAKKKSPVNKEPLISEDQKIQLQDILTDADIELTSANKKKLAKKYGITPKTTAREAENIIHKIIEDFSTGKML